MTEPRQVVRHVVDVDRRWHRIAHDGANVCHVESQSPDVVEFWTTPPVRFRRWVGKPLRAEYEPVDSDGLYAGVGRVFEYRAFGTGQPVEGEYVGTVIVHGGALVWHLFRREVSP